LISGATISVRQTNAPTPAVDRRSDVEEKPAARGEASLLFETGGGLCWAAAGIVAITGAVGNAWVLLIEILR